MKEKWNELLKNNVGLQENVSRIDSGNEMQMMGPYLEAMTMVSAANCLNPKFAPFFLSLAFTELGIDNKRSSAGFVGPSINCLIDKVTEGVTSDAIFGKKADLAASMVLKKLVKFSFILAVALGKLLEAKVAGNEKEKETQELYTKLFFKLSSVTDIFKITLKEFVLATGIGEKIAEIIAKSISSVAYVLMAYSAANNKNFNSILEILKKPFEEAIKTLEISLDDEANEIKAILTNLKLSLENKNFEEFTVSLVTALETIGISQEGFKEDIKNIEEMALRVQKAISKGIVDFANRTELSVGV